jgi:hypothetical protein
MSTELHVKSGGSWRKAKEVHVKASGAWRKAKEVWVKTSGTWRKVFSAGFNMTVAPVSSNPADANDVGFCKAPVSTYHGTFGSTAPSPAEALGAEVLMVSASHTYAGGFIRLWLAGARATDFFTSMTINGVTLTSAGRDTSYQDIGCTYWAWSVAGDTGIRSGGTYTVTFA